MVYYCLSSVYRRKGYLRRIKQRPRARTAVAGVFEVFQDNDRPLPFRFLLRGSDGAVVAVSPQLGSITAVKAGIRAVRESAASGSVVDLTDE
jgi:uncharacterized protein YegP (UPF0339 family)